MGRLERERLAEEQRLGVATFRVRRWTAFGETEVSLRDRQDHLWRYAKIIERRLQERYPSQHTKIGHVMLDGVPQLVFEITLPAMGEADAGRRATYRFERALAAKIPAGMGRKTALRPSWGETEVTKRPDMVIA